jgi:hypothetical protein
MFLTDCTLTICNWDLLVIKLLIQCLTTVLLGRYSSLVDSDHGVKKKNSVNFLHCATTNFASGNFSNFVSRKVWEMLTQINHHKSSQTHYTTLIQVPQFRRWLRWENLLKYVYNFLYVNFFPVACFVNSSLEFTFQTALVAFLEVQFYSLDCLIITVRLQLLFTKFHLIYRQQSILPSHVKCKHVKLSHAQYTKAAIPSQHLNS